MWWTPRIQDIEQVPKVLDALGFHLEDIAEYEFLDCRAVDAARSAAEFDAVDDDVVVCGYCARGVCEQ
jgi:hypothetical protein